MKPSFKSFVELTDLSSDLKDEGKENDNYNYCCQLGNTAEDGNTGFILISGEIQIGRADNVMQCSPCEDNENNNVTGALFVTNRRISFLPIGCNDKAATENNDSFRKNKLIGSHDVALSNVHDVYQVSKGKKKKLLPNTFVSGFVKRLEIHCKDFRIYQFCFKDSHRSHVKTIVNAILRHCYPSHVDLLFAFSYSENTSVNYCLTPAPEFLSANDWQRELDRLQVSVFYVSNCNKGYAMSESLPEAFVLPLALTDAMITRSGLGVDNKCFPVWSFSYTNACSLIRMSCSQSNAMVEEIMMCVGRTHPKLLPPEILDLASSRLPTLKKLQMYYDQLRELCMPSTYKELVNGDNTWFSMLESSQWLSVISNALFVSAYVRERILAERTLIITEKDATDYSALITCLVQLQLDPYSRTISGFQSLIQKEWIALGHKFAYRYGIVYSKDVDQSPVFLLFLDCVWQLLQQYPSSFEFSEFFLISIWDSIGLGMFSNFIFNSPHERSNVLTMHAEAQESQTVLLNVWDWNNQFFEGDIDFFTNPLYAAREQIHILCSTDETINKQYQDFAKSKAAAIDRSGNKSIILRPRYDLLHLRLWESCYLRWTSQLQIVNGGSPSEYLSQSLLMDDISSLETAISELESVNKKETNPNWNEVSALIFEKSRSVVHRKISKQVTSSYPFSPVRTGTQMLLFPSPPAVDLRTSVFEETASMDEISLADGSVVI